MLELAYATVVLCVVAGVALDLILGETRRWHPLVGFGRLAAFVEKKLNRPAAGRVTGLLAWALVVLPVVALVQFLLVQAVAFNPWLGAALHALLLYFCLGLRSLHEHTAPIQTALQNADLGGARRLTSHIVSRDTAQANEQDLSKAAVESLLENGCDAVFGALFWFVVAGGAGALLYRLSNTLDAMWGYRTARLLKFGCAAARIDDGLNWMPARLTALSYALLGNTRLAWQCWREQAPQWSSPNAGPVMAAGAGALGLALGGAATYDGVAEHRPALGAGAQAAAKDIHRAWRLVLHTSLLWVAALALVWLALIVSGGAHA
ncbi:adenosylcobinamide-phosphate synthase CbiB [Undibacterium sp.]|jgi:adenosylcobinamide-phosphate synthase|uniref:adenosylcobinamide-phosphate synthase CbiB n=1 Tax=Undibacterium sp. TaxID=1914977 RepID=UPI002C4AE012|nr:adenosylcobinamide-phosphate synthase CbiB [Undibacterium sp.]HTD02963.1 adenosylcobinamide-phosphate synthase CbiB [Undibacterium sp.]